MTQRRRPDDRLTADEAEPMVSIWNAVSLSAVSSAMRYSAQAAIWLWRFSVPLTIRPPTIDELSGLSDLCFRSKAVWGYDEEFMEACRRELSFEPRDLGLTPIAVAEHDGKPIGVAQLKVVDGEADLLKLFVEPSALRSGTGKALLAWATDAAKKLGATRLTIEADPDAAAFYRRMGAYDVGQAPSRSVPGRMLPKLAMNLCRAD